MGKIFICCRIQLKFRLRVRLKRWNDRGEFQLDRAKSKNNIAENPVALGHETHKGPQCVWQTFDIVEWQTKEIKVKHHRFTFILFLKKIYNEKRYDYRTSSACVKPVKIRIINESIDAWQNNIHRWSNTPIVRPSYWYMLLQSIKSFVPKRLWIIFGSFGDHCALKMSLQLVIQCIGIILVAY